MFHELTVAEVRPEGPEAVAIRLAVPEALRDAFAFAPGQYLTLRAEVGGVDTRRSYSIASLPGEGLWVGVKHVPGGVFSGHAQGLKPGDRLQVMPPEGRFTDPGCGRLVLVAAGSGITPMVALAGAALARGAEVTLVYGNRRSGTIMFREALERLKDRYMDRFTLVHVLSREEQDVALLNGRVDGDKIARLARAGVVDLAGADGVFLCGPGEMIDAVEAACLSLGVDRARIHHERFYMDGEAPRAPRSAAAEAAMAQGVAVEVVLDGARRGFVMGAGDDTVLEAAERQGVELPYSCRGGMCCTCRCRVTVGRAEMAVNWSLEPWELEAGFVLACQARPVTERLALDFDAA
ncbi:2Fe-2S iron-sulfur cluster-binding protein [Roseicyclus persicicus]|uniref:2Fe-2S iron-sulfur cluster binding domain-containing protein n=1 Tax=Roseicyclus persicicus TaxID=2650661 RepID=A0A7X6H1M7_9RHOB|nr:2Fe-2S iron-sulfur cluster-binding protein [Roseibacterium persicicum]NKX45176.1 2Fe-2S iron-sulfur cluster binding domain-containing protein [Roseibacterium persicicum]